VKKFRAIISWLIIISSSTSIAQNFVTLGNDANNDATCTCTDLKKLSVAYNIAQDSVWFKIETYNARGSSYGYYIEIERDKNLSNGSDWTGGGGPNACDGFSNYAQYRDRGICIWSAATLFEQWSSSGGTNVPSYVLNVRYPDAYTMIVNTKLSDVDHNSDGDFDVFASVGAQDYGYDILDIMPSSGFYNTAFVGIEKGNNGIGEHVKLLNKQLIIPGELRKEIKTISVYDVTGKLVMHQNSPGESILDASVLYNNKGVYLYRIEKITGEMFSGKLAVF